MIRSSVSNRLLGDPPAPPGDDLPLADTVVPMPESSMRLLEFAIACAALGFAVLLGLAR
ncbi:MAG TPA: hypothetical protein VFP19_10170 [Candidatus Limnocylindrales bacterium]|nr:hypothetical protein [Candidatus Limnocylindrales bacterium]